MKIQEKRYPITIYVINDLVEDLIIGYEDAVRLKISFYKEIYDDKNTDDKYTRQFSKVVEEDEEINICDERIREIIKKVNKNNEDTGTLKIDIKHSIELVKDCSQIISRPYRKNLIERKQINDQVEKLLDEKKIEESDTPFTSPVLLVKKKDGTYRFCIDYRKFYIAKIKKNYPIPHLEDLLIFSVHQNI